MHLPYMSINPIVIGRTRKIDVCSISISLCSIIDSHCIGKNPLPLLASTDAEYECEPVTVVDIRMIS